MSRISQGFHRIGIVVGAPIAIVAVILAGVAYQERSADIASDEIRAALADARAKAKATLPPGFVLDDERVPRSVNKPNKYEQLERGASPPPVGPSTKYQPVDFDPFAVEEPSAKQFYEYFSVSLLTLAFSIVSYLAIRSIGWIIDGFTREPRKPDL
jgi:hypothetical protein